MDISISFLPSSFSRNVLIFHRIQFCLRSISSEFFSHELVIFSYNSYYHQLISCVYWCAPSLEKVEHASIVKHMLENVLQNFRGRISQTGTRTIPRLPSHICSIFHVTFFIYVYKDGCSISPIIAHDQGCYSICLELVPCYGPCQCCVCWC